MFNFSAIHLIHDPQGILTFYKILHSAHLSARIIPLKRNFDYGICTRLDFSEKLLKQLEDSKERFEVKIMMMELISRLVGIHEVRLLMQSSHPEDKHGFLMSFLLLRLAWFDLIITSVLCSSSCSIFTPLSRGSFSPIREVKRHWQTSRFNILLSEDNWLTKCFLSRGDENPAVCGSGGPPARPTRGALRSLVVYEKLTIS